MKQALIGGLTAVLIAILGNANMAHAGLLWWKFPNTASPKQGLCAIISADTPGDLVERIASSNVVVHCIVPSDTALTTLNNRIAAGGLTGYVSVEKLPLTSLPYRDNMVNQIVVEDIKSAMAAGLTSNELLRVLAPLGTLCTRPGATWQITTKSRPPEMDEWTHPYHGPGGGWFSNDKVVALPVGLRWQDDLPFNISIDIHHGGQWTTTRGIAVSDGRCFTMSTSEQENLRRTYEEMYRAKKGQDMFLTARDSWNGLLLWRRKLGDLFYGGLHVFSRGPLVAVGGKVYTVADNQKLIVLDAATGALTATLDTTFIPGIILVDQNTIIAATWKDGSRIGPLTGIDRRLMDYAVEEGTVEAYDVTSGKKLWSVPKLATSIRSADGRLYIVQRNGPDKYEELVSQLQNKGTNTIVRPEQRLIAFDLRTGKQLWDNGPKELELGPGDHIFVDAAGADAVVLCHNNGKLVSAYRGADGSKLLQEPNAGYSSVVDGLLAIGGGTFDPKTGKRTGNSPTQVGATMCTPVICANGIRVDNRFASLNDHGKGVRFGATRGACMWASIPANGAFYTPQTFCGCTGGQVPGFVAFGPIRHVPTTNEMERTPELEKGPAFGKLSGKDSTAI